MGCSGAVDVRIERLDDDAMTREWLAVLERGEAAVLATPLSGASGRLLVRGRGEVVGGLTDADDRAGGDRARPRRSCGAPFPQSGPGAIGSSEIFFEISDAAARPRDLRRRTRRGAAGAAGLDARFCGDRRRCPRRRT